MEILGYSERGIINSLIFSIGKDKVLMDEFIELINIPELTSTDFPEDYTILLEQSFSQFGDADLILILHYKNPTDNKVLFIEGKVKTIQAKYWDLKKQYLKFNTKTKYNGYSSNLFYQLYLKHLLFQNKDKLDEDKESIVNCGFRDRKIGKNKVVWDALKRIVVCNEAFYIGLVPSSKQDITSFKGELDYKIHFLSWENVEEFCNKKVLKEVIRIFNYNEGQIY